MKTKEYPSQEYLKECLDYNPETGVFTWKVRPRHHFKNDGAFKMWNRRYSNKVAGRTLKNSVGKSYRLISLCDIKYYSHRLAIIIQDGSIDDSIDVDHIDGNGTNNSYDNLRVVSRSQNARNHKRQANNTSGCVGVHWASRERLWQARIHEGGKCISLGYFSNFEDAVKVRKAAEVQYGYHENHGTERPL